MPTNPIDWSKTLIYKIISKDINYDFIYIGSTTDFSRRLREHKSSCNNEKSEKYNYVLYKFIRENGGFDNFNMILVEKYTECKDRLEARKREQYCIDELKPKLNQQHAFYAISKNDYNKRYKDEHKEELKLYFKKRYEDNKDKIKIQSLEKLTCDCGKIFGIYKKVRHERSQYHKDYIKQLAQEDSC